MSQTSLVRIVGFDLAILRYFVIFANNLPYTVDAPDATLNSYCNALYCEALLSPMNDVHLVLMIPLGRRWKSYSFSSTTTVWPALFPPCDRKPRWSSCSALWSCGTVSSQRFTLQIYFLQKGDLEMWLCKHPDARLALYSDTQCPAEKTSLQAIRQPARLIFNRWACIASAVAFSHVQ